MDEKWGLNLPDFPGTDQCVRLSPASEAQTKTSVRNRMDDHFLHNVATQSLFRYLLIGTTSTELHRQSVTQPERRRACTDIFSRVMQLYRGLAVSRHAAYLTIDDLNNALSKVLWSTLR